MLDEFTHEPRVAYFSMEIALRNEIPTYAGGLGVLAGDTVRSAADLTLPLVAVSLVSRAEPPYDLPRVRALCNFTTHTPVEVGHDRFSYDLVMRVLGNVVDLATLKYLAGDDALNMTRLALSLSDYVNGVAERHAEVSKTMFPGYRVHAITNGVHPYT